MKKQKFIEKTYDNNIGGNNYMKYTKSFLQFTVLSLLIHSAATHSLWAMMGNDPLEIKDAQSHGTISLQNTNDRGGMKSDLKSMSPTNPSSSPSKPFLPLEENKQTPPLNRKKQLKQQALQGDKEAQFALGVMFRDGDGVLKDPLKAIKWFEPLANQLHIDAMNALSRMYLEGTDVDQDYKLALKWVKKLIAEDNAEGQYLAGNMYRNGWGVKKDEKEALKWYQKSADQKYQPARKTLGLDKDEMKEGNEKTKTKQEEKLSPLSHTSVLSLVEEKLSQSKSIKAIPEVARGYEDIYERFLKGVLVYRPTEGSDVGKIELPIAALTNPLESTFDLSSCGDTGKYLSIATGYRKVQTPANANKVEIWFTPRFLVDKEMPQLAQNHHIRAISKNWDAAKAPIAIFWTWGGWDAKDQSAYCDYLTTESMGDMGSENLLKKYQKSSGEGRRGGMWRIWIYVHQNFTFCL